MIDPTAEEIAAKARAELREETFRGLVNQEKNKIKEFNASLSIWTFLFPWRLVRRDDLDSFLTKEQKIKHHIREIESMGFRVEENFGAYTIYRERGGKI